MISVNSWNDALQIQTQIKGNYFNCISMISLWLSVKVIKKIAL